MASFKRVFVGTLVGIVLALPAALHAAPVSDDHVVLYQMKEDPTMAVFMGLTSMPGFYTLKIDEFYGDAVVFYKVGDTLYQAKSLLRKKGDQLTLTYKKKRKTFVRVKQTASSGTREVLHPIECALEHDGWRRGASFERRVLRRTDESGARIIANSAALEFHLAVQRCGSSNDCGPAGCPQWEVAPATGATPSLVVAASPTPSAPTVPLAQALVKASVNANDLSTGYRADIDAMFPPNLMADVVEIRPGFRTTGLPYPGVTDPLIEQRGMRIGVISKSYLLQDKISTMTIEAQPLLPEFQAPLPNKCGTWSSDPTKTFFDVRGRPAMFGTPPEGGSMLSACGDRVSVSVRTSTPRSKEVLQNFIELLPFDAIERIAGAEKAPADAPPTP